MKGECKLNSFVKINNFDLKVKEHNAQRVITFKDIDLLHSRPDGTSGRNFRENRKHFVEGEDYFQRNSSEAKNEFNITAPNGLILITESGYLMLVKSLTDDLAWEVQRQLVKTYFRKSMNQYKVMSKELQAIFMLDEKTQHIETRMNELEESMPLFNIECKELQQIVRKIGTKALGGYGSPAYKDNSLRGKVYSDIQSQLKREFGVEKYEAIKRCQLNTAKTIVNQYKIPMVLADEIYKMNVIEAM
jgi:hypothetical protein